MRSDGERQRPQVWKCITRRVFHGFIGGVFGGPIAYIIGTMILGYLHPSTHFMGTPFDLPLVMIAGAIVGALEGPVFGLLWAIKPPRMTLWWLMAAVAMAGLMLAILKLQPVLGLIALTVPMLMAVSITIADVATRAHALSQSATMHARNSQSCLLAHSVTSGIIGCEKLVSRKGWTRRMCGWWHRRTSRLPQYFETAQTTMRDWRRSAVRPSIDRGRPFRRRKSLPPTIGHTPRRGSWPRPLDLKISSASAGACRERDRTRTGSAPTRIRALPNNTR